MIELLDLTYMEAQAKQSKQNQPAKSKDKP